MSQSLGRFDFSAADKQRGCSEHFPLDPSMDFNHPHPLGLFQALPAPSTSVWLLQGLDEHPAVVTSRSGPWLLPSRVPTAGAAAAGPSPLAAGRAKG